MKVLIACEESGIVREAFAKLGHNAWSCDLLPTAIPGNHIQNNVIKHLSKGWDLMIAHPPCTHLSYAGVRWFGKKMEQQAEAVKFFMILAKAPIEKICIENPLGIMSKLWRKYDQIINPFNFGHPERKRTCLWLKGLPLLKHTKEVKPQEPVAVDSTTGHKRYFTDGSHRSSKMRSRTFKGIAKAMAEQWGTAGENTPPSAGSKKNSLNS